MKAARITMDEEDDFDFIDIDHDDDAPQHGDPPEAQRSSIKRVVSSEGAFNLNNKRLCTQGFPPARPDFLTDVDKEAAQAPHGITGLGGSSQALRKSRSTRSFAPQAVLILADPHSDLALRTAAALTAAAHALALGDHLVCVEVCGTAEEAARRLRVAAPVHRQGGGGAFPLKKKKELLRLVLWFHGGL